MNYLNVLFLVLSGAVILGSVILSEMGYKRSILSRRTATFFTAAGIGLASGIIVYCGFGNGDLFGSIATGLIAAVIAGTMKYFSLGKWSS